MIYAVQPVYFKRDYRALLSKVLPVVIGEIGQYCNYYRVSVYKPAMKMRLPSTWRRLPVNQEEKKKILNDISSFILSSEKPEEFLLWLDPEPIPHFFSQKRVYKFDHHDDLDCWTLNLTETEYDHLRKSLEAAQLPADLFIPASHQVVH